MIRICPERDTVCPHGMGARLLTRGIHAKTAGRLRLKTLQIGKKIPRKQGQLNV